MCNIIHKVICENLRNEMGTPKQNALLQKLTKSNQYDNLSVADASKKISELLAQQPQRKATDRQLAFLSKITKLPIEELNHLTMEDASGLISQVIDHRTIKGQLIRDIKNRRTSGFKTLSELHDACDAPNEFAMFGFYKDITPIEIDKESIQRGIADSEMDVLNIDNNKIITSFEIRLGRFTCAYFDHTALYTGNGFERGIIYKDTKQRGNGTGGWCYTANKEIINRFEKESWSDNNL